MGLPAQVGMPPHASRVMERQDRKHYAQTGVFPRPGRAVWNADSIGGVYKAHARNLFCLAVPPCFPQRLKSG